MPAPTASDVVQRARARPGSWIGRSDRGRSRRCQDRSAVRPRLIAGEGVGTPPRDYAVVLTLRWTAHDHPDRTATLGRQRDAGRAGDRRAATGTGGCA
jgi:hypothetical protein